MLDDLEAAEIFACRSVRRPAKKGSKPRNIANVIALCRAGEAAKIHVFKHALTKGLGGNFCNYVGHCPTPQIDGVAMVCLNSALLNVSASLAGFPSHQIPAPFPRSGYVPVQLFSRNGVAR
jgi:hypothetical protein